MAKSNAKTGAAPFGVYSEVGQLRKVMVCAPGRAHSRLTPSNCDQLLFDDVLWVENAKRDHFDFVTKMRDRGVDVVEMHNLLAETVAVEVVAAQAAGEARAEAVLQRREPHLRLRSTNG